MKVASYNCWLARRILGAMACLAMAGCEAGKPAASVKEIPVIAKEVEVVRAKLEPWPETIRVQGSLLAFEEATIGSKLAGRVAKVNVDIGSIVKAGDPLVELVRSELDLRVELAEAQLKTACAAVGITPEADENAFDVRLAPGVSMEEALVNEAQTNLDRARPLVASRAIAQAEYDTLVALLKTAQARYRSAINLIGEEVSLIGVRRKELALAQQAVVDSMILAPFDGVIGDRRVSPGEFVQAGQAVVTLVRADRLRFTAGVPESRAEQVRVGQRIEIEIDGASATPLVAEVSRVSPTVVQSNRSLLIQADVPNPDLNLQAGLFCEAELVVNPHDQAITVPPTAISRFAGVEKVWVVVDGVARQQTIRTRRQATDRVEVVEGLQPDDLLVRNTSDGHDGPIVAIDEGTSAPLQAKLPQTDSDNATSSSDGAR